MLHTSLLKRAVTLLVVGSLGGGALVTQASNFEPSANGATSGAEFTQAAANTVYLPLIAKFDQPTTTFVVNSTDDVRDNRTGDGVCETATGNGVCTVRAAIEEANVLEGADVIVLPAGVFPLTLADRGDHDIRGDVTIQGAGANQTFIGAPGSIAERVFDIDPGVTVTLSGVTVQNGRAVNAAGGGIDNAGTLNINDSVIRNNNAYRSATNIGGDGGGIRNTGTLTVVNSAFSGNGAGDDGGAVLNQGTMTLINVTVSGNVASGENDNNGTGGGVSTSNVSTSPPGGARSELINSTVVNNRAVASGGGIRESGTTVVVLKNTIVANNISELTTTDNCSGTMTSLGNNLENFDTCDLRSPGDRINTDPQIGPLTDNGGSSPTHALLPGSPAINTGTNDGCPSTDQRGVARPQGGVCDIGAFEFQQ